MSHRCGAAPESGPARAATLSPPEVATVRSHGIPERLGNEQNIYGIFWMYWNIPEYLFSIEYL